MALHIPGASEQDQLMSYLVKHCNLTSDQQAYVRKKLNEVYDGAILNYKELLEKSKPEPKRVKKSKPEDVSTKENLFKEEERQWYVNQQSEQDWLDEQRNG